jgi:fructokinase
MNETPRPVLCFGEILWDSLPAGLFPGGAPFNVSYHLHHLGVTVHLASAVGDDFLGTEFLRRLQHWGIPTAGITRHSELPTGTVQATLGPAGDAHYEITPGVAWDQIAVTDAALRAASGACALTFGSLAQRSTFNQATLNRLLAALPAKALRVFDVNLRAPHDDLESVRALAKQANVLKLNSGEAARLAGIRKSDIFFANQEENHARSLAALTGCATIVITAGARGAGLLHGETWHWEAGRPVQVADTVGAGDAFLASLVSNLLCKKLPPGEVLARACRLGEWVATQPGATPAYTTTTPR